MPSRAQDREAGRQTTSYNPEVLKSGRPDPTQDIRAQVTSSTGGKGMSQTPQLPGAPKDLVWAWGQTPTLSRSATTYPRDTHGWRGQGHIKYVEHRTFTAAASRGT